MAKTYSKGFQYLSKKFLHISTAKRKEVIYVEPQIQEIVSDTEWAGWDSFKRVCANFFPSKGIPTLA
jgi:hypothetical protein